MSKTYTMKQCILQKGTTKQQVWIPEKFAVENKIIGLKDSETKEWDEGWKVISVGNVTLGNVILDARSQDYKNTRKASDL
jgi:hypothetical protein